MEINSFSWTEDREWLVTNGLGGYASSTITGLNTRKYHGLLVVAFSPEDRRVMLSKINEQLSAGGSVRKLSTNQYWDAIDPEGYKYQKSFSLIPQPRFVYETPEAWLEKTIYMPHGFNAIFVEYNILPKPGVKNLNFSAELIVTSRDSNWVLQNPIWELSYKSDSDLAVLTPQHENPPTICIGSSAGKVSKSCYPDNRHRGLFYRKDLERGYSCIDDLFIGVCLDVDVAEPKRFVIVCSADPSPQAAIDTCRRILKAPSVYKEKEKLRLSSLIEKFNSVNGMKANEGISNLVVSSDEFLIRKRNRSAIVAGYPWFGEWGRDSLVSLPGLCLTTSRKKDAEEILLSLMAEARDGLIPNNFTNGGAYNSVDATLWFYWTVWKYLKSTGDFNFIQKRLWMDMKKLLKAYSSRMDSDYLIKTDSNSPMTWMDAVVDGSPVTLRRGKPVEVQALWYNALIVCARLAERAGEKPDPYLKMAVEAKTSFADKFINHDNGYLYDVIDGGNADASIRPNALFAISLDFPILDKFWWPKVMEIAERELVTPYGLRTLNPSDPRYRGFASGTQREADLAYHNGDSWPWLMGSFIDAYVKVYPTKRVGQFLKQLLENQARGGAGKIAEIYDGSSPHNPGGCISQAWSVAELLRVLSEHRDRL